MLGDKATLDGSHDMEPVHGSIDVAVPAACPGIACSGDQARDVTPETANVRAYHVAAALQALPASSGGGIIVCGCATSCTRPIFCRSAIVVSSEIGFFAVRYWCKADRATEAPCRVSRAILRSILTGDSFTYRCR